MTDDKVLREMAKVAREEISDEGDVGLEMIDKMINVCEKHDVPDEERIDLIIEGVEIHMEQMMEQSLQEFERSLRQMSGL